MSDSRKLAAIQRMREIFESAPGLPIEALSIEEQKKWTEAMMSLSYVLYDPALDAAPERDAGLQRCLEQAPTLLSTFGHPQSEQDVAIGGRFMERTISDFHRAVIALLADEQQKPAPNNALISVLCDAVRLCRENVWLATGSLSRFTERAGVQAPEATDKPSGNCAGLGPATPALPAGMVMVPRQWTSEMAHAGYEVHKHPDIACAECGAIYVAMIQEYLRTAAPQPAAAPTKGAEHE